MEGKILLECKGTPTKEEHLALRVDIVQIGREGSRNIMTANLCPECVGVYQHLGYPVVTMRTVGEKNSL